MKSRTLAFAALFWTVALGFIAFDWLRSAPHKRFDEPLPWQFWQEKNKGAGHCAAPLK
jgi:hypothetical protein